MTDFHSKYEKCFLRAIITLKKYRIAELLYHEHPEFDLRTHPNKINYASATFHATSPMVLENLIDHLNKTLEKHQELARIEMTNQNESYMLTIKPDKDSPKETWMEQTQRVMCGLGAKIEDFRMKTKR